MWWPYAQAPHNATLGLVNLRALTFVSLTLVFASSCVNSTPRDDGPDGDATVVADGDECLTDGRAQDPAVLLGTGQFEFLPYGQCQPVSELVYGAQGGFHVWGRVRVQGITPDIDLSFRAVRLRDGRELHTPTIVRRWNENGQPRGLSDQGGGVFQTDPELVILALDCARNLVGDLLQIDAIVRERATQREHFVRSIVRVIDEIPSPPQCVMLPDAGADSASADATDATAGGDARQ